MLVATARPAGDEEPVGDHLENFRLSSREVAGGYLENWRAQSQEVVSVHPQTSQVIILRNVKLSSQGSAGGYGATSGRPRQLGCPHEK